MLSSDSVILSSESQKSKELYQHTGILLEHGSSKCNVMIGIVQLYWKREGIMLKNLLG